MYHEDGRREIAREVRGKAHHSLDPSSGESNYHYVTTRHAGAFHGTNIYKKTAPPAWCEDLPRRDKHVELLSQVIVSWVHPQRERSVTRADKGISDAPRGESLSPSVCFS